MRCPKCNKEIDADSIFCEWCGEKLERSEGPNLAEQTIIVQGPPELKPVEQVKRIQKPHNREGEKSKSNNSFKDFFSKIDRTVGNTFHGKNGENSNLFKENKWLMPVLLGVTGTILIIMLLLSPLFGIFMFLSICGGLFCIWRFGKG